MPRKSTSASRVILSTNAPDEHHPRVHASNEVEEIWMKIMEVVFARGTPTEEHISDMIALARAEQEEIELRMRRTLRIYKQSQSKH
jgi:hypothetical protein